MDRRKKDKELIQYENGISCFLEPGYIFLVKENGVMRTVLGSCVSVCLWDKRLNHGAMNHFLYPWTTDAKSATPKYGNVATAKIIQMMIEAGSKQTEIVAQIFGGARLEHEEEDLGVQNVEAARKILIRKNIKILSEDIGGYMGRKIVFDVRTGQVAVLKVHADRIRESDWLGGKK